MTPRVYILVFQVNSCNLYNLEQFLRHDYRLVGFWNYIPLVYCFKSYLTSVELFPIISSYFPGGNFMFAEVNAQNMNGILPQDAWSWFYAQPEFRKKPEDTPYGNLLSQYLKP